MFNSSPTAYIVYLVLHKLIIWPYLLSPLRKVPGPPIGNLILGQSRVIVNSEAGIPQREWVKKYGPVVRLVGPVGIERLMFMEPDALHQLLVKDWLRYPRVSLLLGYHQTTHLTIRQARIPPQYTRSCYRIWITYRHWR